MMPNCSLIFAAFVSVLLLAGCKHTDGTPPPSAVVEQKDQEARDRLDDLTPAIPASVIKTPQGKVDLGNRTHLPGPEAREKWQEDRNRLDICVATHQTLVSEMTVRGMLTEMATNE